MPINPNTRYYVEAQTLQIAYNKCTDMMQKCVSSMKRILISSIITGVLTMIIWIASIIICGFSFNHAVFLITFLLEVGIMILYGRDSKNIAINPDMNENVQIFSMGISMQSPKSILRSSTISPTNSLSIQGSCNPISRDLIPFIS